MPSALTPDNAAVRTCAALRLKVIVFDADNETARVCVALRATVTLLAPVIPTERTWCTLRPTVSAPVAVISTDRGYDVPPGVVCVAFALMLLVLAIPTART